MMSRVRVCLFVLFLVLNIAVQFGDCEDTSITNTIDTTNTNVNCDEQVPPGSNQNHLSLIELVLKHFEKLFTRTNFISKRSVRAALFPNDDVPVKSSFSYSIKKFRKQMVSKNFQLIFPGTLWCGDGDKAEDKDDLGKFNKTDACCRAHDNCKNFISAGETKGNLKNVGLFTRSACICDNAFYDCLKDANTVLSKGIGKTYFNILKQQCFECACPTNDCNLSTSSSECKDQCDKFIWIKSRHF